MGNSVRDLVIPKKGNDLRSIVIPKEDQKKKDQYGNDLEPGTSSGSQSISASPLPSEEDQFNDDIIPRIAEIAKKQDDKTSGLFTAPLPQDQLTQNIVNARSNKILAGDTDEMIRTVKKQRDILNARKEERRPPKEGPTNPLLMRPGNPLLALEEEDINAEKELDDIKDAVAKKIDKESANKLLTSSYENSLPLISEERRRKRADLGLDNTFEDEKGAAEYAKSNDRTLGGIIKVQKNKDSELFKYNNAAGLLNATLKEQQEQLERLSKDTKVNKYLTGTPEEQALLQDDPTIEEFNTKADRFKFMYEQRMGLANKFPTVKYEQDKVAIADAYAERLNVRNRALGAFGDANVFRRIGEITVGNRPEDNDIKAIAQQLNMSEDDVRKHVELDDTRVPSLLGRTWLAATGVAQSVGQGIIRNTMDKDAANVTNREIEETKYKTNDKYADKYSADWIFDKMSNGLGQMIGFVGVGRAATGAVGLLGRGAAAVVGGGRAVVGAEAAAAAGGRAVVGITEGAAATEIAAAGTQAAVKLAAGASSAAARATLATVNNRISEMLVRASTTGATFGTGYYASYNDEYNEAAKNTQDEGERHLFAKGVAAANGVSELLLNDINLANKILKGVPPAEILSRIAGKKTAFTTGNVFLARMGEVARVMGYESVEELVPYFTELVMKDNMFGIKTSTTEVLKGAFDTVVETAIATVPMGAMSLRSATPTSPLTRNAIYEGAKRADYYRSLFKDQHDAGKISEATMNDRVKLVNTLDNIYQSIPNEVGGEQLSEPKKAYVTSLMLRQRQLADDMEKRSKLFRPEYEQEIKEIDAQIKGILQSPDEIIDPVTIEEDEVVPPVVTEIPQQQTVSEVNDEFRAEELFVPTIQASAPRLTAVNTIGQEIIDSHQLTDMEEIDDNEIFTTFLTPDQAGLAEAIDTRVQVESVGNRLMVRMPGVVLRSLINTNQNATNQTQTQDQESGQERSSEQYISTDQREQESAQEETQAIQADISDSISDSETQGTKKEVAGIPTLDQRLQAARETSAQQRPDFQDNLRIAREDAARQQEREAARTRRNQFTEAESPIVLVNPEGTVSPVNETRDEQPQNIVQENEEVAGAENNQPSTTVNPQQPAQQFGVAGLERAYQFGPVTSVPASDLTQSESYRKGKPLVTSAEFAAQQPVTDPILVHRNSRGQTMVLDGRARLAGAKSQGQESVPVRYFKGTDEQAREVAELLRKYPHRSPATLIAKKADMVLSRPPETFREAMLQMLLGHLSTGIKSRKVIFNMEGFKKYVRSVFTNDPTRSNNGKATPEWTALVTQKIIGPKGQSHVDTFITEGEWMERTGRDESDLIEEMMDVLLGFHDKETIINQLADIQALQEVPLKENIFPISVTEEEAIFIAENSLADVLVDIAFSEGAELSRDEADLLGDIVRFHSDQDGANIDIEGVYWEVFNSEDPDVQFLAQKLIDYAKTKQSEANQSAVSNDLIGEEETGTDWIEAPFSVQSPTRKITSHQANILTRVLDKVFGKKTVINHEQFFEKLKDAMRRSQVSLEVHGLMLELDAARQTLEAAQRSFNAKRRELDAGIKADQVDMFGERKKQPGGLFDERASVAARDEAMKPFAKKLNAAKTNVNSITQKLQAAQASGGTIQGAMFSKDNVVMGFVLDGTVYLNPNEVRVDTPLHEIGGHLLTDWAKANNPQVLEAIYKLAASAPESVINHIKRNYPTLEEGSPQFLEEVFATALGWDIRNIDRAEQQLEAGWKKKLLQVWRDFLNVLAERGIINFSQPFNNADLEQMTLSDFSNLVGEVMFSGRKLSSKAALPNIKAMGADFSLLDASDFVYDNYGNIVDVKHEVKQRIVAEKLAIRSNTIANGTYMQAPDGTRTKLTEDQWLVTQTQKFKEWDINKPELRRKIIDAVAGKGVGGIYGDTLIALAQNPVDNSELIRYLTEQALDSESTLSKIMGRDVVDMVLEYEYSKGTVLTDDNGEPRVFNPSDYAGTISVFERADGAMKSANNIGTFSDETNDLRFQRIGVKSRLTPLQKTNYNRAVEMEQQAVSPENIFLSTGWFRDNGDGQWRYELPNNNVRYLPMAKGTDANITLVKSARQEFVESLAGALGVHTENAIEAAKEIWLYHQTEGGKKIPKDVVRKEGTQYSAEFNMFNDNQYKELYRQHKTRIDKAISINYNYTTKFKLADVLDYPELYEAHPDLADMDVNFVSGISHTGMFTRTADGERIEVSRDVSPGEQYVTLRHEVQHALQHRLGFENGADLTLAKKYYDKKVAGIKRAIKKLEVPQHRELLEASLDGLIKNENEWVYNFYRNFAGEREASGVEDRSGLADDLRVHMMPAMPDAKTVIRHSDMSVVAQLKNLFGTFFKKDGAYRGDPLLQAVDSIGKELTGAKAVAVKLRQLAKAIEGDQGNLSATLLALPKAIISTALKIAANVIEAGGSLTSAVNRAVKYISENVHQNTKLNLTDIRKDFKELMEQEGVEANATFRRSLNIMGQIIDALKNDPNFLASPEFLSLYNTAENKYTAFRDLPENIKDMVTSLVKMNFDQMDIYREMIRRVVGSKVKNLEAKHNREVEAIQDQLAQAARAGRNWIHLRVDVDGNWSPRAVHPNKAANATYDKQVADYIKRLDEWETVKSGESVQEVKKKYEKIGGLLLGDSFIRESTNNELSNASMRILINEGYAMFGASNFTDVMYRIMMDKKFNPVAKSAFQTNILQMDLGYSPKILNSIARIDKLDARRASDTMNMRRLQREVPEEVEQAMNDSFDESGQVNEVSRVMGVSLSDSDVSPVQEEHEDGITQEEGAAQIAQLKEDAKLLKQIERNTKKRDAELLKSAKEMAKLAESRLVQQVGQGITNMESSEVAKLPKTKAEAIALIKERIKKLKC